MPLLYGCIYMYACTCPLLFSGLREAWCCSRTFTTTSCPLLQATCSGVQPWLFTVSIYRWNGTCANISDKMGVCVRACVCVREYVCECVCIYCDQ